MMCVSQLRQAKQRARQLADEMGIPLGRCSERARLLPLAIDTQRHRPFAHDHAEYRGPRRNVQAHR